MGEDGTLDEAKHTLARGAVFFKDFRARDVAGHQVGRELNATELQVERLRQRAHQQRFGQAGHPDQQRVAACQQAHDKLLDDGLLTDDDLADLPAKAHVSLVKCFQGITGAKRARSRHRQYGRQRWASDEVTILSG